MRLSFSLSGFRGFIRRRWPAWLFFMLSLPVFPTRALAVDPDTLLPADKAFILNTARDAKHDAQLDLQWTIAPGYYLYRDRLSVVGMPGNTKLPLASAPGEQENDPNFGVVQIYHGTATAHVDTGTATSVVVTWQGCAEAGVCYPPLQRTIRLADVASAAQHAALPAAGRSPATSGTTLDAIRQGLSDSGDQEIAGLLAGHGLALSLSVFFVLGIALAFTPCMLPMIPILSSMIVGSKPTRMRSFTLSAAFVAAMALVYAALGMIAAIAGRNVQVLTQQQWVTIAISCVFVLLALAMFGFYTLQLPQWLRALLSHKGADVRGGTLVGAALSGALSAVLVGPCMTAPLAGALLYIAQGANALSGALLLLALGLGMGAPLLVVGTVGARILPRPGPWMDGTTASFGFVLLAMAVWFSSRVIPASLTLALWGLFLLLLSMAVIQAVGVTGAGTPAKYPPRVHVLGRGVAIAAGVWGVLMLAGAAVGADEPWRPLGAFAARAGATLPTQGGQPLSFENATTLKAVQEDLLRARRDRKPALVDFTADWCTSCKTIDRTVFDTDADRRALAGMVLVKADVTASGSDASELMRAYGVIGPPTVLLFDRDGNERRPERLVGEFDADQLRARLLSKNPT